jgi:uncharacterized surface protein with fasciclin (FAS1) repeats
MATILQIMNADRYLSLFSRGVKIAELETKLNETGPFTLLGPVNLAIDGLVPLAYEQLLKPANRNDLFDFLCGYILVGKKLVGSFRNGQQLETLNGGSVAVSTRDGETFINGAKILSRDRQGSNGVVHVLDKTYDTVQA